MPKTVTAIATWIRMLARRAFGQSTPLIGARLLSAALTFALPLMLARYLTPQAFGTYKQFFLVAITLLSVMQLGITQSLYYFLPRGGPERGAYLLHAAVALALLGAVTGVGLYLGGPLLARMGDGALPLYRLPLALYVGLMLASFVLEAGLTSDGKIGVSALCYVVSDGLRAGALIYAAQRWPGPGIFWAASAVALVRVAAAWSLIARGTLPSAPLDRSLFAQQLAFALPFAGSTLLYVGQRYASQYVVSARFDSATFALFAVAAFHLPVIDIVFTPITEVLMVRLGKTLGDDRESLREWDDAVEKLASILFPATCAAWLFGPTILPLLFTSKYSASVPLFMLATVEIPLWILPVDALLRAAGDTRFLFGYNAGRIVLTVALVIGGVHFFGLAGAIAGGITSEAIARAGMLWRGRRWLGASFAEALDWSVVTRIAAAAVGASLPAYALERLWRGGGVGGVAVAAAVYAIVYLALRLTIVRGRGARPTVAWAT